MHVTQQMFNEAVALSFAITTTLLLKVLDRISCSCRCAIPVILVALSFRRFAIWALSLPLRFSLYVHIYVA
jgi:hypothetical protein